MILCACDAGPLSEDYYRAVNKEGSKDEHSPVYKELASWLVLYEPTYKPGDIVRLKNGKVYSERCDFHVAERELCVLMRTR